jgi:magnesium-transporting ATPase (P-type)
LPKEKKHGFFKKFLQNLGDPIIRVLLIALAVEVIFTFGDCNFFEVGGILVAVLIATTVSTLSELGSERAFDSLEEQNARLKARVVREGKVISIDIGEIVSGDIVFLAQGETVPADGIMLEGALTVNQAALNGESADATKTVCKDSGKWSLEDEGRIFRGSVVTGGSGVIKVLRYHPIPPGKAPPAAVDGLSAENSPSILQSWGRCNSRQCESS